MSREVFRNEYYELHFDAGSRVLRAVRTAVPQPLTTLDASIEQIMQATSSLRPARLLVDVRKAPGNNDPVFELESLRALRTLQQSFGDFAVLVQTGIGRLHFQRMGRSIKQTIHVFVDEAEALRFLSEQPLTLP